MVNFLNALAFAALLFLVSSGLTLIFGLMRVINLSHGALYLLAAYIGYSMVELTGSFWVALAIAPAAVGLLGYAIAKTLRRALYGTELNQVLLTLGIALVLGDLVLWSWGPAPRSVGVPAVLDGHVILPGEKVFPVYRLAIIGIGAAAAIAWGVVWQRTRLGAVVRAGVDDAETLGALGTNVAAVFTGVFVAGSALAGFAGVLGAPILGVSAGLAFDVLLYSIVIVVLGGLGSLRGALMGSIVVALAATYSQVYVPTFFWFAVFGPALLVLALRPQGLFGMAR